VKDSIGPFAVLIVLVLVFAAYVGVSAYSDLKGTVQQIENRVDQICKGEVCR